MDTSSDFSPITLEDSELRCFFLPARVKHNVSKILYIYTSLVGVHTRFDLSQVLVELDHLSAKQVRRAVADVTCCDERRWGAVVVREIAHLFEAPNP